MPPTGKIQTPGIDGTWDAITRYDAAIHTAADPVGWPIARIRGTLAIESKGDPAAVQRNASNGDSYGLMQVVPYGVGWAGWSELVKQIAGLPKTATKQQVINALYDPAINIAVGVAILEQLYLTYGSLDDASSAFFTGKPGWQGAGDTVNKNTPGWYRKTLNALIAEQKAFGPVNPIDVIVGGASYPPIDYGFGSDAGLDYYKYGVGHGLSRSTQHTGYDVGVALGTRLYTPAAGVVDCVGGRGTPRWGQGCGAYNDTITGGVGNITILLDSGHKLTLGHCNRALVSPGERVAAGQQVGTSGGMNGPHVHVEVSVERNGSYWLIDPGPALMEAMGGQTPVIAAERLPIPQPEEFDISIPVIVTTDTLPVLQRADLTSPQVSAPLVKGETFGAVYQVVGNDGAIYWVSTRGARLPVKGTSAPEWLTGASSSGERDEMATLVEDVRQKVDALLRGLVTTLEAA